MDSETKEILKDIRRWLKIVGLKEAKPLLAEALSHEDPDEQKQLRIAYHLTDGSNGRSKIADHISYSRGWVRNRHKEWSNMGLIERDKSTDPYHYVIGLQEAGMDVPEIPDPERESTEEKVEAE